MLAAAKERMELERMEAAMAPEYGIESVGAAVGGAGDRSGLSAEEVRAADEERTTTPAAANSFLDTNDPERVEYLYSIPDEAEPLDEDFADEWATAVTKAATTKGWLVLVPVAPGAEAPG